MKEERIRDMVRYETGDPTQPTPVPRDDDGHPDAKVQRALDMLDDALADWSARNSPALQAEGPRTDGSFGAKLARRGYVLILVTTDTDGAVFRSVSEHEMPLDQAMVALGSQS